MNEIIVKKQRIIRDELNACWNLLEEAIKNRDTTRVIEVADAMKKLDAKEFLLEGIYLDVLQSGKLFLLHTTHVMPAVCVGCITAEYRNEWIEPCHSCLNGSNKQTEA